MSCLLPLRHPPPHGYSHVPHRSNWMSLRKLDLKKNNLLAVKQKKLEIEIKPFFLFYVGVHSITMIITDSRGRLFEYWFLATYSLLFQTPYLFYFPLFSQSPSHIYFCSVNKLILNVFSKVPFYSNLPVCSWLKIKCLNFNLHLHQCKCLRYQV